MTTRTNIELDDGRTVHEFSVEADGEAETITGWISDDRKMCFETDGGASGTVREAKNGTVKFHQKIAVCGIAGVKKLPADEEWCEAMTDDVEAAREEHRASEREKELTFTVFAHESRLARSRTPTLQADKTQLTDDDRDLIDKLDDVLGTVGGGAHGRGLTRAFEGMGFGETITAEEARERLDADFGDELAEATEESDRQAAREALADEHPELRSVAFEADEVRAAFEEAAETGHPVVAATGGDECDGSEPECSWDRITVHAMPDGGIDRQRVHTH